MTAERAARCCGLIVGPTILLGSRATAATVLGGACEGNGGARMYCRVTNLIEMSEVKGGRKEMTAALRRVRVGRCRKKPML